MAKPDPALLDPARYPFVRRIDPRFSDLDVNGHVNNVALAGILEDARSRFHDISGFSDLLTDLRSLMASVTIDYLAEGYYPDPIDVHVAVASLGRTSHSLAQLAVQGSRILACARTVHVTVNGHGPAPTPPEFAQAWSLKA